jgi:hypothetical protein
MALATQGESIYSGYTLDSLLSPNCRCFDRQAAAAPAFEEFEVDIGLRAGGKGLGSDGFVTPGKHAMRRSHRLPQQPIDREAIHLALGDRFAAQMIAGMLFVTIRARQIELAPSRVEEGFAAFVALSRRAVDLHIHRQAARLIGAKERLV